MLEQIVTQPTRDSNTLGLCVSPHTLHGLIQGPDIDGTFLPGLSDHNVVIVSFATKLYLQNQPPLHLQESRLGKFVRRIFLSY